MVEPLQAEIGIPGVAAVSAGRNGLPRISLTHPSGAAAAVYLHGGHVTSWRSPAGEELLFLSRESWFEAGRPIRGGIPLCFPQFGPGPLPQHGFARASEWRPTRASRRHGGAVSVTLRLEESPETLAMWPHPFGLDLEVLLGESALTLTMRVENTGSDPFDFQGVFHTYFGVADIRRTAVRGLQGVTFIDSLREDAREVETREAIRFDRETDRIYVSAPDRLQVCDEARGRSITIEKSGMPDSVVWNPWIEKAQRMPDFGGDEYQGMVCVETGIMESPLTLKPAGTWMGKTTFRVEG